VDLSFQKQKKEKIKEILRLRQIFLVTQIGIVGIVEKVLQKVLQRVVENNVLYKPLRFLERKCVNYFIIK
jgi:hypothetical protein